MIRRFLVPEFQANWAMYLMIRTRSWPAWIIFMNSEAKVIGSHRISLPITGGNLKMQELHLGHFPGKTGFSCLWHLLNDTLPYYRPNVEGILLDYKSPVVLS